MARRHIVGHGVNLELYAATHGEPNIVGQAIGGIGTVLGEAFDKAKERKTKADNEAQLKAEELENKQKEAADKKLAEIFATNKEGENATAESISDLIDSNQAKFNEIEKKRAAMGEPLEDKGVTDPARGGTVKTYQMVGDDVYANYLKKNPGQFFAAEVARSNAIQDAKAYNMRTKGTQDPTEAGLANNVVSFKTDKDGNIIPFSIKPTEGSTAYPSPEEYMGPPFGGPPRLKNPLKRRRSGRRGSVIQGIDSLMGTSQGVTTSAADTGDVSRFTPGRTFVEKERRLSAPSWMGIGAAAIEGWNLGVEKENYKKQVQADLQDYYQQEFKGLEVGRTGNDLFDQSMQEVLMGEKKKLAKKLQDRDAAFARGEGATWTAEYGQMKKVPTQIANLVDGVKAIRKDLLEKYEDIDWDAMSDEQKDEVMTFLKGGAPLGLAQTESGLAVLGATRGGMPYLKNVQAMLQEGGGPKVILKKNPFNYVASVVEEIRKNPSKYSYTDEVNGVKTTKMLPMEQLMPYLDSMFDQELLDKSDVRAYASPNNFGKDGLTPELFDISVNQNKDPRDFVKKKFREIATDLLYPQQQVYDRQGTARLTQMQKARLDQQKQDRKASQAAQKEQEYTSAAIDLLGDSSEFEIYKQKLEDGEIIESSEQFYKSFPNLKKIVGSKGISTLDVSDGVATFYGKQVDRDGKKTTPIPYVLDLSQPYETILQQVANMVKETGYIQVDKKSNFRTKYNY